MVWSTYTKANQTVYTPPAGAVMGVNYSAQGGLRELALFFVAQDAAPLWHAVSINGQPQKVEDAKDLLRRVYNSFSVPCWTQFEDTLLIWPPAINDGDILVVEINVDDD